MSSTMVETKFGKTIDTSDFKDMYNMKLNDSYTLAEHFSSYILYTKVTRVYNGWLYTSFHSGCISSKFVGSDYV